MPSLKNCRLDFLQGILKGTKTALKASEVPARKVPHWTELALKHIYPQIVKTHPDMLEYLPAITVQASIATLSTTSSTSCLTLCILRPSKI